MSIYAIRLSYLSIECDGCHATRVRGLECADCGRRPAVWEVDTETQGRQRAIGDVVALLDASLPQLEQRSTFLIDQQETVVHELGECIPQFLGSLDPVVRGEAGAVDSLRLAIEKLNRLSAVVDAMPRRRPYVAFVDSARVLVVELREMARDYLSCLIEKRPLVAQKLGDSAQAHLDEIAVCAGVIANKLAVEAATSVSSTTALGALVALSAIASSRHDDGGLLSASEHAQDTLEGLISIRVPVEVAAYFVLTDIAMDSSGDPARFREVLQRAYVIFGRDPDVLRELCDDGLFGSDLESATIDLLDNWASACNIFESAQQPRQILRELAGMVQTVVEGLGQLLTASLLKCSGKRTRPYARLRDDNVTELLRSARQDANIAALLVGLDGDVRTAVSHRMVRYTETGIELDHQSSRGRRIDLDELADLLFASFESCLSLLVALRCAVAAAGLNLPDLPDVGAIGGSPAEWTAGAMAALSGRDVTVLDDNPELWRFHMDGFPARDMAAVVGGIACQADDETPYVELCIDDGEEIRVLHGPSQVLAAWRDEPADTLAKEIAFMRMLRSWTWDDRPCVGRDGLRKWVATKAGETLSVDLGVAIYRIRMLRALAVESDRELDALLKTLIRALRIEPSAPLGAVRDTRGLGRLSEWLDAGDDLNFPVAS